MTNFKIDVISDPICPWVSLDGHAHTVISHQN
jgi:hypothetical protein